jgi:RNA polymerase sigma factor (TIGR02999 family)
MGGNNFMSDAVTGLLIRWGQGDKQALDELLPLAYDELRRLARKHLRGDAGRMSLQPTMLLHEAYLKLAGLHDAKFENRARFFAMSATIMRNILVDHVRERIAAKRGGGKFKISLSQAEEARTEPDFELLALDDALKKLSASYPQHAHVVELRYFSGFNVDETAQALGMSPSTVHRHWNFAKAWLKRELAGKVDKIHV